MLPTYLLLGRYLLFIYWAGQFSVTLDHKTNYRTLFWTARVRTCLAMRCSPHPEIYDGMSLYPVTLSFKPEPDSGNTLLLGGKIIVNDLVTLNTDGFAKMLMTFSKIINKYFTNSNNVTCVRIKLTTSHVVVGLNCVH